MLKLKNGIKVANLCSPHPFKFTTGEVLPAVDAETASRIKLGTKEVEISNQGWIDIRLEFQLSDVVLSEIKRIENTDVDVILVPFPIMAALKENDLPVGKCRTCRVADRNTKLIFPDKFCI